MKKLNAFFSIYTLICVAVSVMLDKSHDGVLAFFAGFFWAFGLPGILLSFVLKQPLNLLFIAATSIVFWLIVAQIAKRPRRRLIDPPPQPGVVAVGYRRIRTYRVEDE